MTRLNQMENAPFSDGRRPVEELYHAFAALAGEGWVAETVAVSSRERNGRIISLPIPSFRTSKSGRAVWILSGIHGEEPAGPNAIASAINLIRELGREMPVVLLPLCNPLGYASNWRYLDRPDWQEGAEAASAGDSEHVLPGLKMQGQARTRAASSAEAAALVAHILSLADHYPPGISVDFHEDNLLDEGYIYSQGRHGANDEVALNIVAALSSAGIPLRMAGTTRFGEEITRGVVGPQSDGSVDELLAAERIIIAGKIVPGPRAKSVIVIETPAAALPLFDRQRAHLAVLGHLREIAPKHVACP